MLGKEKPMHTEKRTQRQKKVFRDHPFKTLAFFRGKGSKNLPNLPT